MSDVKKRVHELDSELTVWDGPWAGSFAEVRDNDAQVSSGYNEPQVHDDAVSYREIELVPDE